MNWRKASIRNLTVENEHLLMASNPAGDSLVDGNLLTKDCLALRSSHNGYLQRGGIGSRQHNRHLVGLGLLEGGVGNLSQNAIEIERESKRVAHLEQRG